jgi:hypothetical protein
MAYANGSSAGWCPPIVVPAKAGTTPSGDDATEQWVPAFAGTTNVIGAGIRSEPLTCQLASAAQVQHANQGEQAAGRIVVDRDLAGQPLGQEFRPLVMQ